MGGLLNLVLVIFVVFIRKYVGFFVVLWSGRMDG